MPYLWVIAILIPFVADKLAEIVRIPRSGAPDVETTYVEIRPGPTIHCDSPVYDFGLVWTGPVLKHDYVVRNLSGGPVRFLFFGTCAGTCSSGPVWLADEDAVRISRSIYTARLRSRFESSTALRLLPLLDDDEGERCHASYDSEVRERRCGLMYWQFALPWRSPVGGFEISPFRAGRASIP